MTHQPTYEERLLEITKDCRDDMHEPDEQDLTCMVSGFHLDNAVGDNPTSNFGEFTVGIGKGDGTKQWFNLATLIALARIGAKKISDESKGEYR